MLMFSAFLGFKHSLPSPELLCVTTEEEMALKQQPGTVCNNSKCDEVQSRSEEQGLCRWMWNMDHKGRWGMRLICTKSCRVLQGMLH